MGRWIGVESEEELWHYYRIWAMNPHTATLWQPIRSQLLFTCAMARAHDPSGDVGVSCLRALVSPIKPSAYPPTPCAVIRPMYKENGRLAYIDLAFMDDSIEKALRSGMVHATQSREAYLGALQQQLQALPV